MPHPASEWQLTTIDSATLARRLTDPADEEAWHEIESRYGPLVRAFAISQGLSPELAEDARQEAMMGLVGVLRSGRYDRSRGRLRDLLFAIARHKILDLKSAELNACRNGLEFQLDSVVLATTEGDDEMEREFLRQWHVAVTAQCLREARARFTERTYEIFYLVVVEGRPAADVAARLDATVGAVNMAVHHVRTFLRTIERNIEEVF